MKMPTTNSVRAIFAYVLVLLVLSQFAFSLFAWQLFDRELPPEMDRKAATIGHSIEEKLSAAILDGIPFDRLVGVDEFFADLMKGNPELAFLVLTDTKGKVRNSVGVDAAAAADMSSDHPESGDGVHQFSKWVGGTRYAITELPVAAGAKTVGALEIGVSQGFIDARVGEIRLDIIAVVLISLLVAYEVLRFIISASLEEPLWQVWTILGNIAKGDFRELARTRSNELGHLARAANRLILGVNEAAVALANTLNAIIDPERRKRAHEAWTRLSERFHFATASGPQVRPRPLVVQVRILTFLFMFAEQLSRPFLPMMVQSLLPGWARGQTADLLTGMPISAFMFVVALGMPVAGRWCDRIGARDGFTAGAVMMTVGLIGAALSFSIYDFTCWRVVTAAGYAAMFMACQGFVIGNTAERERAQGISTFVGAIMVSEVCAPAIGGILADRIGPHPVFGVSAVVAVIVALLGRSILRRQDRRHTPVVTGPRLLRFAVGLHNPRFVALLLFAAVPAKMILTGFLFFLVPLLLTSLGATQAEIGRIVIAYGIPGLLLMPAFATLADRMSLHGLMVGLGGIVAGAGMLPILFHADETMVLVGVAALGLGQAMSIAPQIALIGQVCEKEIAAYGQVSVFGIFRLVERTGAALGSLVAGVLLASLGPINAMAVLGAGGAISAVIFSAIFLVLGVRPETSLDAVNTTMVAEGANG